MQFEVHIENADPFIVESTMESIIHDVSKGFERSRGHRLIALRDEDDFSWFFFDANDGRISQCTPYEAAIEYTIGLIRKVTITLIR